MKYATMPPTKADAVHGSGPRQKVLKSLALVLKSLMRKPRPASDLLSKPPAPPARSLSIALAMVLVPQSLALTMALLPQSLASVLKSLVRKLPR